MSKHTPESTSSSAASDIFTLDEINAVDDRAPIKVRVPEWGGKSVKVRALTLQQLDQCNKRSANPKRGGEINLEVRNGWYLVEGVVEPSITLEIAEKWLTERAAGPVADVLAVILDRSGLSRRSVDAAKSGAED